MYISSMDTAALPILHSSYIYESSLIGQIQKLQVHSQ